MYLDSSVKLYSICLLLTLVMAMPNLSQSATVEVRLNNGILANATVEDSIWNGTLTTDGAGLVSISNDCIFLRYLDENNNAFRSMETCGMNEADRVYRVNLRKEITLSGTVEYSDPRNANLSFINLDEGQSLGRGINWNTLSFSEKLPAGRYRIKVRRNTWPTPVVIITSVLWAWTLLVDQCPGLRWVQKTPLHLGGRVNLHART